VLDPFGGSGSTLIAAKARLPGSHPGIDPKYVDVIVRRWQEFTGKQAFRESDGSRLD
jgi:DNA modification methylase